MVFKCELDKATAGTGLQSLPNVSKLVDNWMHSEDIFVRSEAVRARSSLASLGTIRCVNT